MRLHQRCCGPGKLVHPRLEIRTRALELVKRLGQLRRGSRALSLELIGPVRCNRPATQLRQLAVSTVQLGARLRERRLGDRALAYERSDPGIERFELRA